MLNYPLQMTFKILAISPQVKITDASGETVMYVKQKALALREDVKIFADEAQQQELYRIKANKIMDFSARYTITAPDGQTVGAIQRQGMRSLWKATYTVTDVEDQETAVIHEENPMIKVLDAIAGEIPFLGMFINPAYLVDLQGQTVLYFKKKPSFVERQFEVEKRGEIPDEQEELLLASIIMMVLLERDRG